MKNKLKDNLLIKIISLLAAIVLWLYIQSVQTPIIDFTYSGMDISLINSSLLEERNLIVVDDAEFKSDITVNCPRWSLSGLKDENFSVYVDLSEIQSAGIVELPVKVRVGSENILVTGKNPSSIKLNVDNIVTVEKNLEVHTDGKVKAGFYTDDSLIKPATQTITVEGPKSIVSRIANGVITVDLKNKSGSFDGAYDVVLEDDEGTAVIDERITVLSGKVNVSVEVLATKVLPVTIPGISQELDYSITPSSIEIAGPIDLVETMNEIVVDDFVLLSSAPGYTQDISIKLPEGFMVLTDVVPQLKINTDNQ